MPFPHGGIHPHHFKIPKNNSGNGNALQVGRGVSVYWDLQPPNVWLRHRHPTAQILLALDPVESRMTWWQGQTAFRQSSETSHLWCLPAGTPHAADWRGTAAMVVLYVERDFIIEECGSELTEGMILPLTRVLHQDYMLGRICRRFHDHCHRRRPLSDPMLLAGAIMVASAVLHLCIGRTATKGAQGLDEKRLETIAQYLQDHIREPLDPATLAGAIGMSVDHFGRMFLHSTGLSPMRYVWRCRVHRARELLETGEWKVAQVAAELGFYDQSHLDRKFRREFGCTPGFVIPISKRK